MRISDWSSDVCSSDLVVVENFRPGQLDRMGLGPDVLRSVRPDLIVSHISGYGQTGPYRDRAAFGVIGEAIGGLRHLTNHPPGSFDLPPEIGSASCRERVCQSV